MAKEFVHLHTHTEHSLLDGANKSERIAETARKDGQTALAITDHGNMFGALGFYNACKAEGLKPIIGCEVYVAKKSRRQRHSKRNGYNHLTLLAQNEEGYKNLLYLTSLSYIEGLSLRPRIDFDILSRHAKGIVCLSGCLSGRVNDLLMQEENEKALEEAAKLRDLFGHDNFWIELQRNGLTIQDNVNVGLVEISKKLSCPLIATNDIHYLRGEDCDFQDTLLCVATGARKSDETRFRFDTDDVYMKSQAQMAQVFKDLPNALKETKVVEEMIDVEISQGKFVFPEYDTKGQTPEKLLEEIVFQGITEIYGADNNEAIERAEHELSVINRMGYPEYFLIVRDIIQEAHGRGIPVGPGRGSAAGSIVSYASGITAVDPLKYNLIFERFLNDDRAGLPDIDIDFCKEGRAEVIDFMREKYGEDRVANIITFGTFGARSAVRQTARVLDVPLRDTDIIAKKIPEATTIKEAIKFDPTLKADFSSHPTLLKVSQELEGFVSHSGTHASGVVIGDRPLYEIVPLARNDQGVVITQWDGIGCEQVGLVKFDILGLATLTIIERAQKLIEAKHGKRAILDETIFKDKSVYDVFYKGNTEGVFQCFSDGMKRLLVDMHADCFDEIVAAVALFRPGPLESGITKQFVDRKHGLEKVSYPHPSMKKHLKSTYGLMVYQEQIMQTARELAGFTLKEADELRKAVGKKKMELLNPIRKKWLNGCKNQEKISDKKAISLWDDILKFGRYGFNVAHAVSYSFLSLYTAYLKKNYPIEFFAANLTQEANEGNVDKIKSLIYDCRRHNIEILPPDLRDCAWDFRPVDDTTIHMGLGGIKGIGHDSAVRIAETHMPKTDNIVTLLRGFTSMTIKKNSLEALIKAGALDFTGIERGCLHTAAPNIIKALAKARKKREKVPCGPMPLDPPFKYDEDVSWTFPELLAGERQVYDFYLSGHPMNAHKLSVARIAPMSVSEMLSTSKDMDKIEIVGVIATKEVRTVKGGKNAGKKFARLIFEDSKSQVICMLFTHMYGKFIDRIDKAYNTAEPLILTGKIDMTSEDPQMIIANVKSLNIEAERSNSIALDGGNIVDLQGLKRIFEGNPGTTSVSVKILSPVGNSVLVRLNTPIDIESEEVKVALEEVL
jgi:DNA polymerase-3 subunit alpha